MFAVLFTEVEKEFISHIVTVFDFLTGLRCNFVFDLFVFACLAVDKLDGIVDEGLEVVDDEVGGPDLVFH